jgi:hypothetical protein
MSDTRKKDTRNCVQPSPFNYHSFSERALPIKTQKITKTKPHSTAREAMFLASIDTPHLYHTQKFIILIHFSTSRCSFAWWVVSVEPSSGCATSSNWGNTHNRFCQWVGNWNAMREGLLCDSDSTSTPSTPNPKSEQQHTRIGMDTHMRIGMDTHMRIGTDTHTRNGKEKREAEEWGSSLHRQWTEEIRGEG